MSTVIEPVKVKFAPVHAPVYGDAGCTATPMLTDGVGVRVIVGVGVTVGVLVGVLVGVFVGVKVRVGVGVFVGVGVLVGVGVGVGPRTVRINSLLL